MTSQLKVDRISPATGSEIIIDGLSGGGLESVQHFTSSGTWTKTDGITKVVVEVQGAGGGGSVGASYINATCGAYGKKLIDVSLISTATITVGAGGAGGLPTGPDGGLSSWDDGTNTVSAMGGYGGSASTLTDLNTTPVVATAADLSIEGGLHTCFFGALAYSGAGDTQNLKDGFGFGGGGAGNHDTWPGTSGSGANGIVIVTEYK